MTLTAVTQTACKDRRARSRATLEHRLRLLLDDGTGQINPALQGLLDHLVAMPRPMRGYTWLRNNPQVPALLRGLARGDIPLTHEALHQLPSPRTTAHLRDLLMQAGALPRLDRQVLLFEQWAQHKLNDLTRPDDQRLLRQFVRWQLLPALRANPGPLTTGHRNAAATAVSSASTFLAWAAADGRTLHALNQHNLDRFAVNHPKLAERNELRRFLSWAIRNQHMPRLRLPALAQRQRPPISQHHRLTLIRRMLTDTTLDLSIRVAALLLLLFAQPVSTLLRLTIDDIVVQDTGIALRLGDPPTPVPEPFATLLRQHVAARPNMNTAANPTSRWLFPGGRPGQPLNPSSIRHKFQALGLPTAQARTAAFRQLTLQAPPPVIAQALGYDPATAQHHHAAAGGTWNRYTTVDRTRHS